MANDTLDVMMEAALKKQSQITGKFIKKQLEDAIAKLKSDNNMDELIKNGFLDIKDWVMTQLGYPVIDINLDDKHYILAFTAAVQLWHQHHYDGSHVEYFAVPLTQVMKDEKKIKADTFKHYDAVLDVNLYPSSMYMNDPLFGSTWDWVADYKLTQFSDSFFSSDIGVDALSGRLTLSHFMALEQSLRTLHSMVYRPIQFTYKKAERTLHLLDDRILSLNVGDLIVVQGYKNVAVDDIQNIMDEIWIKEYMTAKCKEMWGSILRMIRNTPLLAGNSLDYSDMLSEAQQKIVDLEAQLINVYELPLGVYYG